MLGKFVTVLALVSTVYSVEFQIKNNSPDTPVFIQLLGTEYPDPFTLQGNEEVSRFLSKKKLNCLNRKL